MNIYLDNGYLNMKAIIELPVPFIFIAGARGIGKTYGSIDYCCQNRLSSIYMRRMQRQTNIAANGKLSPYRRYAEKNLLNYKCHSIEDNIYECSLFNDKEEVYQGLILALSTMANLRGLDGTPYDLMILDEFIPETHERAIRNEADVLFNAYETISRNREIEGKEPLKFLAMANSNNIINPIFKELQLIRVAENLSQKSQEVHVDEKKGYALIIPQSSPISEQKKDTALYKLTEGTAFNDMALDNQFSQNVRTNIASKNFKDYTPLCRAGELTILRQRSGRKIYITSHDNAGGAPRFGSTEVELERFRRHFAFVWFAYIEGLVTFEEYVCEAIFRSYFGKKY